MLEAFRQNAAIGWMMITMVEGIVKLGGVGVVLYDSWKHYERGRVMAIIFCILVIGLIQDVCLGFLQRIITPHAVAALHAKQRFTMQIPEWLVKKTS